MIDRFLIVLLKKWSFFLRHPVYGTRPLRVIKWKFPKIHRFWVGSPLNPSGAVYFWNWSRIFIIFSTFLANLTWNCKPQSRANLILFGTKRKTILCSFKKVSFWFSQIQLFKSYELSKAGQYFGCVRPYIYGTRPLKVNEPKWKFQNASNHYQFSSNNLETLKMSQKMRIWYFKFVS